MKHISIAVFVFLAAFSSPKAHAGGLPSHTPYTKDAYFDNASLLGCEPFRIENSSVPVLVAAGSGMLYELVASSGVSAQSYTMAFDTAAAYTNGVGVYSLFLSSNTASNPKGYAITPKVFTNSGFGAAGTAGLGYFPVVPKRFESGLVVAASDTGNGLFVNGCYRLDGGSCPSGIPNVSGSGCQ